MATIKTSPSSKEYRDGWSDIYGKEKEKKEMTEKKLIKKKKHNCYFNQKTSHGLWGHAAKHCYEEDDGTLWITNDEYMTQVNYCPLCGHEATTKI